MRHVLRAIMASTALGLLAATAGAHGNKPLEKCPGDAVVSRTTCMDKYEASVWRVPDPTTANKRLVKKIQRGQATSADLTAGGAAHLGTAGADPPPYAPCAESGQNCTNDIYAVSLPGAIPSSRITWFQAQQACKNARKRLPSNAEWQVAVAGTPDPGPDNGTTDCNSAQAGAVVATGSRSSCVSSDGAFDMVGNLYEWVADWVPLSTNAGMWSASVSSPSEGDSQYLGGAAIFTDPGALLRGGGFSGGGFIAGPLSVVGGEEVSSGRFRPFIGFRCAR